LYSAIFYILFIIIAVSAFYISFGRNILSTSFSMVVMLLSVSGIYVMLNAELFALINILLFTGIAVLLMILFPAIRNLSIDDEIILPKSHFFSIIILGTLTALLSSLVSSTRWKLFNVNYEFNSLLLIFTKYLPLIILIAILTSVIITSLSVILNKNTTE
jgi:NADH:ubiquinone oxidoreductase subunit 6 (subunit J)